MKKLFFFLALAMAAFFFFDKNFFFQEKKQEVLVKKEHPFVFVVYSFQNHPFLLKTLSSIFEQEYENFRVVVFDDGSLDESYEKAALFREENHLEGRLDLIYHDRHSGSISLALYQILQDFTGKEIVIPMEVGDFLAHPKVLKELNICYQDPDVWMTLHTPIFYPSYAKDFHENQLFSRRVPHSFYASLFRQILLKDLLEKGEFKEGSHAYLDLLVQMSQKHCVQKKEAFSLVYETFSSPKKGESKVKYPPISHLEKKSQNKDVDLLIFSYHRPMQLYACLESLSRYFSGYRQIHVLCRADLSSYRKAYQEVAKAFPHVQFIFQSHEAKKDFKKLLLKQISSSFSSYLLFAVDDQMAIDFVDLQKCVAKMEETGAYGFYLRLGKEIDYCYQAHQEQKVPKSLVLNGGIYAWSLEQKEGSDWDFPNNLDMTIYRKKDLEGFFRELEYKTPNSLEFSWSKKKIAKDAIGLYFESAKVVNIPLNLVGRTGNPHMGLHSVEELLVKFQEGYKMDIDPLYQIEHRSAHIEYFPRFIER